MNDCLSNPYRDYLRPGIESGCAAGLAIVPTFSGLQKKTDLQLGRISQPFTFQQRIFAGLKAAPTLGITVAIQTTASKFLEKRIKDLRDESEASSSTVALSAFGAAAATAHLLAAFNAQTAGKAIIPALRIGYGEFIAIAQREGCFLGSLAISKVISDAVVSRYGENLLTTYGLVFAIGVGGSVAGHRPDSKLTLRQHGLPIRNLWRGVGVKGFTLGVFNIFFYETIRRLG